MMHKKQDFERDVRDTFFTFTFLSKRTWSTIDIVDNIPLLSMGVSQPMASASRVEKVKARLCQHGVSGTIRSIVRFYIKYNNSRC